MADAEHQLLKAVKNGDVEEFKQLVANDSNRLLKASSPQKNTALHVAARFGHTGLVQEILQRQNLLLVLKNLKGDTPMHVAARAGHIDVVNHLIHCAKTNNVETLISRAKIIDEHTDSSKTSFSDWAKKTGQNARMAFTTPHDNRVDEHTDSSTASFIDWAKKTWQNAWQVMTRKLVFKTSQDNIIHENRDSSTNSFIDRAKKIVQNAWTCMNENDIEIGSKKPQVLRMIDKEGNTPLHGAVMNRHLEVVQILISEDPELSSLTNKAGESPLSIAVDVKASDILFKLMAGRDMSPPLLQMGCGRQTLLHGTIIRNDLASMEILLKRCPELVEQIDEKWRSPLHYAAAVGNLEMVERLLKSDASLAYKGDKAGKRPVHMAAEYDHVNVLTKLLDECPDSIELLDKKYRNLLHLAAQNGKIDTVEYILKLPEMEDLINQPDGDRNTPLHLSAKNLQSDVVQSLLQDPRVNIWATNAYGITALKVVEYLLDFQVSSNGKADINDSKIKDISDGDGDDKKMVLQKHHFTLKVLKEARTTQVGCPKDILERRYLRKTTDNDRQMASTLITIATLVASFTFTAIFNVPGGFTGEGMAALSESRSFQSFVIFDTIAMTSSMTAVVIVFSSSWDPNNDLFVEILSIAIWLTWLALTSMGIAFVTGLFAVLSNTMWLAILVCLIGCAFPTIVYVFTPLMFIAGLSFSRDSIYGKTIEILSAAVPFSPTSPLNFRMGRDYREENTITPSQAI